MANSSNDYCDVATATGKNDNLSKDSVKIRFNNEQLKIIDGYNCKMTKLIGLKLRFLQQFPMYVVKVSYFKGKKRAFSQCTFRQPVGVSNEKKL